MDWRTSSYSGANGGQCVELAGDSRLIMVRDSANRDDGTLVFSAKAWQEFTARLR